MISTVLLATTGFHVEDAVDVVYSPIHMGE